MNEVYMLPQNFKVYTNDEAVVNWQPNDNFREVTLPTYNHYQGADGGYVALYTRDPEAGLYSVGDGIYVMGQVRLQGTYFGQIFVPAGYQLGDNITQDPDILDICKQYFPEMQNDFWVGGDTGGWYQPAGNVKLPHEAYPADYWRWRE